MHVNIGEFRKPCANPGKDAGIKKKREDLKFSPLGHYLVQGKQEVKAEEEL